MDAINVENCIGDAVYNSKIHALFDVTHLEDCKFVFDATHIKMLTMSITTIILSWSMRWAAVGQYMHRFSDICWFNKYLT